MLQTIADMAVAQYMFNGLFVEKAFRSQVFPGVIDDIFEGRERHRDIVFVRFSLLGYSLCNAFTKRP